jgi:hypothetical protein
MGGVKYVLKQDWDKLRSELLKLQKFCRHKYENEMDDTSDAGRSYDMGFRFCGRGVADNLNKLLKEFFTDEQEFFKEEK